MRLERRRNMTLPLACKLLCLSSTPTRGYAFHRPPRASVSDRGLQWVEPQLLLDHRVSTSPLPPLCHVALEYGNAWSIFGQRFYTEADHVKLSTVSDPDLIQTGAARRRLPESYQN
jgi:hypothetical protein